MPNCISRFRSVHPDEEEDASGICASTEACTFSSSNAIFAAFAQRENDDNLALGMEDGDWGKSGVSRDVDASNEDECEKATVKVLQITVNGLKTANAMNDESSIEGRAAQDVTRSPLNSANTVCEPCKNDTVSTSRWDVESPHTTVYCNCT